MFDRLLVTIVRKEEKRAMAQVEMGNLYASYIRVNKKKFTVKQHHAPE